LAVVLILIAPAAWGVEGKVYQGRFSYHWSSQHHSAIMAEKFVQEIRQATGGRLEIQTFPQGQLYGTAQTIPALAQGSVDIGGILGVMFMQVDKNFYLTGMSHLFSSYQQMRDFWETDPIGNRYWTALQQKLGIKILVYVPVGPACYFSNERALDSVAAFNGLKARTLVPTDRFGFKPLGIHYVNVTTSEVYNALKTGMINTLATVPSTIKGSSWWDFLKYAQKPYQLYADGYIAVNLKWWNSLPADIQNIVEKEVAPRISTEATEEVMAYSEAVLQEFVSTHNGTVSTLSETEFQKLVNIHQTAVYPEIAKSIDPELYQAALKFIGRQ
jgi:TRAP-type C4-dicarboxylate transport system substrate-binding protein